ncbi:MAG: DUF4124 domain-containing protein, partial [Burkholderiales bacterium]
MRAPTLLLTTTLVATLTAAASFTANAELFRWVDERGGINYSDRAPAKSSNVKDLSVVQDRLSVYSPDRATLEMVQRAREHGDFWPRSYERLPPQYVPVMPSASGGPSVDSAQSVVGVARRGALVEHDRTVRVGARGHQAEREAPFAKVGVQPLKRDHPRQRASQRRRVKQRRPARGRDR